MMKDVEHCQTRLLSPIKPVPPKVHQHLKGSLWSRTMYILSMGSTRPLSSKPSMINKIGYKSSSYLDFQVKHFINSLHKLKFSFHPNITILKEFD